MLFKVVCGCGNEVEFTPEVNQEQDEERGFYVCSSSSSITFWQEHDVVGFACKKCNNAIYTYT